MKLENEILESLKNYIINNINTSIDAVNTGNTIRLDDITKDSVVIDYPDTDSMKANVMFYILPENESFSEFTLGGDLARFNNTVYIIVKKDNQENLIKKVFRYYGALMHCIKLDPSLASVVDETKFISMEFYPAVEANKNIVAIELHLEITYEQDYQ